MSVLHQEAVEGAHGTVDAQSKRPLPPAVDTFVGLPDWRSQVLPISTMDFRLGPPRDLRSETA